MEKSFLGESESKFPDFRNQGVTMEREHFLFLSFFGFPFKIYRPDPIRSTLKINDTINYFRLRLFDVCGRFRSTYFTDARRVVFSTIRRLTLSSGPGCGREVCTCSSVTEVVGSNLAPSTWMLKDRQDAWK